MKARAGIDEAGFGPMFGPLCIGYSVFEVPDGVGCLRSALRGTCGGRGRGGDPRVPVRDSKLLHQGPHKLARLERTALAFLAVANGGRPPATMRDVIARAPTTDGALAAHPWYADLDVELPLRVDRGELDRCSERLARGCERAGVRVRELGVRVIPEGELNALLERTRNKSVALFESVLPVLRRVRGFAELRPVVVCDRHGGRVTYASLLAQAFAGSWVTIVREQPKASLYRVAVDEGRIRIAFAENGERRSFACALASCLAKYSRELAMERWNAYFARLAPGVKRTAGYVGDARRYLREAREALAAAGVDPSALVRVR